VKKNFEVEKNFFSSIKTQPPKIKPNKRKAAKATENFTIKAEPPKEAKTKRFNAVMRPSLYNSLKVLANNNSTSINDLIHRILSDYIEKHRGE
jgi:predicted HicB family RNase H-like nuclease